MPRLVASPHNSLVIANAGAGVKKHLRSAEDGLFQGLSVPAANGASLSPMESQLFAAVTARLGLGLPIDGLSWTIDPRVYRLTMCARTVPSATVTFARVTGRSKRRGPALPGFR